VVRLYQGFQLGFAVLVLGLISERAHVLLYRARTSDYALGWLRARLRAGESAAALAWAERLPASFVGQTLLGALGRRDSTEDSDLDPELVRVELRHAAGERLGVLRGCATLASALGLLGGILAIREGFSGGGGLLALQAGLAQQVALASALESMALGVATSAVCFHALGVFRVAARELLTQSTHIAHLLAEHTADRLAPGPGGGS
jgi:hypothetical protein